MKWDENYLSKVPGSRERRFSLLVLVFDTQPFRASLTFPVIFCLTCDWLIILHCFIFQYLVLILLPVGFVFVFAFHLTVLEPRPQCDRPGEHGEGKTEEGIISHQIRLIPHNIYKDESMGVFKYDTENV